MKINMKNTSHRYYIDLNGIKVRVFFEKNTKKSTCAIMIRIIVTFANQVFLFFLLLGSRNMIKVSKNISLEKIR